MPPGLLPPLLHTPSQRALSPSISLQTKAHCRKQGVNLRDPAEVLEMAWDGWSGGRTGEDGGGCFQDQSRAPTGAGVSLPIQPDEHRFVSLRFSRCRSAAAVRTGPYMVLWRSEVITETVLETLSLHL